VPRSRWISDLHWVRTGQQSRSQKTQAALLDAAALLFSEKGIEAASVADVAERAGCSVGSVYHHFRDKKALLYAVVDRLSEEFRATTRDAVDPARWEGASVPDILRGYLEFSLEVSCDRPSLASTGREASRTDPALREHLAEVQTELNNGLMELLLARRDEMGHPDPVLAAEFVLDQIGAMIRTRLDETLMPALLTNRSDEEFIQETLRSCCTYLHMPMPEA
jgi:AcrR family transcriptional regulator